MLTPKQRFQSDKAAAVKHGETVDTDAFLHASDMAMLQFQEGLPIPTEMGTATANFWRIQGAQLFLKELLRLHVVPKGKKEYVNPDEP